jgi:energy-coupling factor transporter transmembrane protein EcfT
MRPIVSRPAVTLVLGLALVLAAALTPAGLAGQPVPAWAWLVWLGVFTIGLAMFRAAGWLLAESLRRVGWLLPFVALLAVPAGLASPAGRRGFVALALAVRALSAAAAGAGLAVLLGPAGLVRGLRQLHMPDRLVEILEATLASLAVVTRQVSHMLRAREARRPRVGAWSAITLRPVETVRGFGRLVAALLLRSLERAEALERARRARGGAEP